MTIVQEAGQMFKLLALSLVLMGIATVHAHAGTKVGDWARYSLLSARPDAKPSVVEITIAIGPRKGGLQWWEMIGKKPDGSTFAVRVLSEHAPMAESSDTGQIQRYLFRDGAQPMIEYRDKASKTALLPRFDFRTQLLPNPMPNTSFDGGFATTGAYLGGAVQLVETGHDRPWTDTGDVKLLSLDPTLIVGTGRCFRDTDDGRVTGRNYNYRNFTPEEYDEMVAAGINFFIGSVEQEPAIRERPAFYTKTPVFADYPSILYRGNYCGMTMFSDEPAILTNFQPCQRVTDASNLLRLRTAETYASRGYYGSRALAVTFENTGVCLGTWELIERDIPAWEAVFAAAYHEAEGGVSGVVHEGRYNTEVFNTVLKGSLDLDLNVTSAEMLSLHYAFLRGSARCFNTAWGTSIYGQADPSISPLAIQMAYDMGARYVWFWTSDNGHHMPYREQLELSRMLRDHAKAHPRKPISELLHQPKTAVAFPEGYIGWSEFWPSGIWNNERFGFKKPNDQGVPYGKIIAEALRQGVALARKGTSFDFVVEGEPAHKAGYERIIHVRTDGSVETEDLPRL
jgi:hypothetical protein